jgi:hypothetical protein
MQHVAAWFCPANLLWAITWVERVLDALGTVLILIILIPGAHRLVGASPFRRLGSMACFLFQIPYGDKLTAFTQALLDRYRLADNGDGDRAVAYVDRIIDRQINKARGILPFNSILMTFLSFEATRHLTLSDKVILGLIQELHPWILISLAISSVLMLELFWSHWGPADTYKSFTNDLTSGCLVARDRAVILDVAIILSVASIAAILLVEWIAPPTFS